MNRKVKITAYFLVILSGVLLTSYVVFTNTIGKISENEITESISTENVWEDFSGTSYSEQFVRKAQGQQWFLDLVEENLKSQGKTLSEITSKDDFQYIFSLGIEGKNIEGKIPVAIGELSNLKYLYFSKNNLSGTIPKELFTLSKLENLDLSENKFDGTLNKDIGQLKNLKILLLWGNQFTGALPEEIGELSSVTNLDLSENNFTGVIPSSIANLKNLELLSVSKNKFEGQLPLELGELDKLKVLFLWENLFSGELPASFNKLTSLEKLDISNNQLTGIIQPQLESLTKLTYLDISNNLFVGDISSQLSSENTEVYAENNFMFGKNIAQISHNQQNLIDGLPDQVRLSITNNIETKESRKEDLSSLITLVNASDLSDTEKLLNLNPMYLEIRLENPDDASRLQIINDQGRFSIKPLKQISASDNVFVRVYIKANEGSEYSIARVQIIASKDKKWDILIDEPPLEELPTETVPPVEPTSTEEPTQSNERVFRSYIKGYDDGTFKPDATISREEMAQIIYTLYKDAYKDDASESNVLYNDVTEGWSSEAIQFVTQHQIMKGYPDGSFRPQNDLTRAELTVIVSKLNNLLLDKATFFTDAKTHWATEFISAVNNAGYMSGYPDGYFRPDRAITRAEVVITINKTFNLDIDKEFKNLTKISTFKDVTPNHWAYKHILVAALYDEQ